LPGEEEERGTGSVHPRVGRYSFPWRKEAPCRKRFLSLPQFEVLKNGTEEESDGSDPRKPWITDLLGNSVGTTAEIRRYRGIEEERECRR
jgi:hypothetical protein